MIVSQQELEMVSRRKMRRSMMRLPVQYRDDGSRKPCPVRAGKLVPLQAAGARAVVTVTEEPYRERVAALTIGDARREGYASVQAALDAWEARHGKADRDTLAWVVPFILGDLSTFMGQDDSVYLKRVGDFTTVASEQTVRGDPPLMMPLPEDMARARRKATEARLSPQREAVDRLRGDVETLLEAMTNMKDRNRLRLVLKEIDKLSVSGAGTLPASACVARQVPVDGEDVPRLRDTDSFVPLEAA